MPLRIVLWLLFVTFQQTCHSEVSISQPGPDMANFPNSAFTLPQGGAYAEIAPVQFSGRNNNSAEGFNAGYFLRYGLLDDLEIRVISDGFAVQEGASTQTGIASPIFDVKWHLFDAVEHSWIPAMGIEVSVQSNWASKDFKGGTQPALSLNFDQTLPGDIAFEYNIGFAGTRDDDDRTIYQLLLSWAFQRNVTDDIALFINGYTNTAAGPTSSAIGGGAQWLINERFALFSNISAGLTTHTPSIYSLIGFALAF